MEFLNLHSSALDSPEMAGADPAELGTWLMLARYCAGQENGGVIAGCREWRDRKWQTVVRVAQAMVMHEAELWTWDGDDLHVKHYPAEQEAAVKAKRERNRSARSGARVDATRHGAGDGEVDGVNADLTESGRSSRIASGGGLALAPVHAGSRSEPDRIPPASGGDPDPIRTKGKGREGNEREVLRVCENEREGEDQHASSISNSSSLSSSRDLEISRQAETIVRSYPRQERFAEALMMVRGHLASGESFPEMLAGTKAAAEALAKAPAGAANKYAPSALKFFEGKRWMDDPATLIRPPTASAAGGNGGGRYDRGEMSAEELALQLGGRAY